MEIVYPIMKVQRVNPTASSYRRLSYRIGFNKRSQCKSFNLDSGLLYDTAGNLAACAGAVSTVPQILMLVKTKDARSFSHTSLGISIMSSALWFVYGVGLELPPTVAASTIALLSDAYIVYCKLSFKDQQQS